MSLSELEKINFPLIYDELRDFFPENIENLEIKHKIK
jgi:hypothetical protein